MTTTTAKLAGKILDAECGITDSEARRLYDTKGSTRMAIAELKTDTRVEDEDGKQTVTLRLIGLEIADTPQAAEHLRELQRAIWRKRDPQHDLQSSIDIEPTDEQVLQRGKAVLADYAEQAGEDERVEEPQPVP